MRKAFFIGSLAALVAVLFGAAATSALAQDSGTDQYLENPGTVPEEDTGGGSGGTGTGGGGTGGGGGGSGGGTEPAPSEPATEPAPSDEPAPTGGSSGAQGAASGATTTTTGTDSSSDAGGGAKSSKQDKQKKRAEEKKRAESDKNRDDVTDSDLGQAVSSGTDDSGSGGIGIVLPIILGALLLAVGVVAVMRLRRAKTSHA
jgi:hypothetical protein